MIPSAITPFLRFASLSAAALSLATVDHRATSSTWTVDRSQQPSALHYGLAVLS